MDYHIVGIAGAGMSAIAHMLLDQGYTVSGSDIQANRLTERLQQRGVTINIGHQPTHGADAAALIATSAVPDDHGELQSARQAGKPVLRRADIWQQWSQQRSIIAIAGTHGKTTTTAMLTYILQQAGVAPGFLIGAEFPQLGTNACWGDPQAPLIIEADEYDHTFLGLVPDIAVITTLEWDHPDTYPTEDAYNQAFVQFAAQARQALIISDYVVTKQRTKQITLSDTPRIITYGLVPPSAYQALLSMESNNIVQRWLVRYPDSNGTQQYVPLSLTVPGMHNVRNALAALCVVDLLHLDMTAAAESLRPFQGVARRFEVKGEIDGITIIDDYAHHPTEARATLAAARERYPGCRILAYIQPHTYSRTLTLLEQWQRVLSEADIVSKADVVFIGAVYPSRETAAQAGSLSQCENPSEGVARLLVQKIAACHGSVSYVGGVEEAAVLIAPQLHGGDVLITMGAGDGYLVGEQILYRRGLATTTAP